MSNQKLDPFYIDIGFATSVEFQARLTDYVSVIENFPNEAALSSIYRHTDSHSDPITSKIEFWKDFATGALDLRTPDGGQPENFDRKKLVNKNFRDQLRPGDQPVTDRGGTYDNVEIDDELSDNSGSISVRTKVVERKWVPVSDEQDEFLGNGKWETEEKADIQSIPVTGPLDIQKSELDVDRTYDPTAAGKWMLFYWIEKFRTAHPVIQRDVKQLLGENNLYFRDFSESIGSLKNITNYFDTSTLPVWDADVNALGEQYSTPTTVNSVANYITKSEARAVNSELSRQTNRVYRSNMQGLFDDAYRDNVVIFSPAAPNQLPAHGSNLVTDMSYYSMMTNMIESIISIVQQHTLVLYGVLEVLSNRENYMQAQVPKSILMKVEDFTVAVDLLKNRIKLHNAPDTSATVHTRYGKATSHNTNMKNHEILMSEDAMKRMKTQNT